MIRIENLNKTYFGASPLHVLKGINLSVDKGEFLSIMGSSGSGKSTLLNILGILDTYDSGDYFLDNVLIKNLSETKAAELRNKKIGFVFQSFNLIPFKNAMENVALPLYYQGISRKKRNMLALEYLDKMGLKTHADHLPSEMSGGQKQRVAIARALIAQPQIILADEPTGALDSKTSDDVMDILRDVNSRDGITMIIVTHEQGVAEATDRIIHIKDGVISRNEDRKSIHLKSKEEKKVKIESADIDLHKRIDLDRDVNVLGNPISIGLEATEKSVDRESITDVLNDNSIKPSNEADDSIKAVDPEKKEISFIIPQIQIIENAAIEKPIHPETEVKKLTDNKILESIIDKNNKDESTKIEKDKDVSDIDNRRSDPGRKWQYI